MSKLWEKGIELDVLTESFTVGEDYILDQRLIYFDILGSLAHGHMLHHINILSKEEWKVLHAGLMAILSEGHFSIAKEDEDVHTAVEGKLGEVGKKLHAARSRNDQITLDLRLFAKEHMRMTCSLLITTIEAFQAFARKHCGVPIPGRTHMQRAMPSSLGLWAGSFMESLSDDLALLQSTYDLIDQSPLGSAAGYGSSLPVDRTLTAKLLGFKKVQSNVLYAGNSRGKFEAMVVHALVQVMQDLSKWASDLIFFSLPEIGYLSLPASFCTGSSFMPQKNNPDSLELIRAKAATMISYLMQLLEVTRPLPSGYHRDFQETKGPFMKSFDITQSALAIAQNIMNALIVNEKKCLASFSNELFATDAALKLVEQGIPFRTAYQHIAQNLEKISMPNPEKDILTKKHLGATGNLNLNGIHSALASAKERLESEQKKWAQTVERLTGEPNV